MVLPPAHSLNQLEVTFSPAHHAVSPVEGPGSVSLPITIMWYQFGWMCGCIGEGHLWGVSSHAALLLKPISDQGFPNLLGSSFLTWEPEFFDGFP